MDILGKYHNKTVTRSDFTPYLKNTEMKIFATSVNLLSRILIWMSFGSCLPWKKITDHDVSGRRHTWIVVGQCCSVAKNEFSRRRLFRSASDSISSSSSGDLAKWDEGIHPIDLHRVCDASMDPSSTPEKTRIRTKMVYTPNSRNKPSRNSIQVVRPRVTTNNVFIAPFNFRP